MFKQLNYNIIGGVVFIAILLLVGSHLYSQWSFKRFASELDVPLHYTTSSETVMPSKQSTSKQSPELVDEIIEIKPKSTDESVSTHVIEDKEISVENTEDSEFDPIPLLTTFGFPEEVTSLLDGEPDEEAYEEAQEYLEEKYGDSEKVEAIMDRLKQMSEGPIGLDSLTSLLEELIQVLPEEQQEEKRRQLMNAFTMLRQSGGQGTMFYVVTDPTKADFASTGVIQVDEDKQPME